MTTYKIVRKYFHGHPTELLATGVTRAEAMEHCSDPETSSSTCTRIVNIQRTEDMGPWFECFYEEDDDE